ncbi:MAG: HNH endonuclease [Bacteroidales bacterium]
MTYAEKLKDPKWQKKRLEILERDNWTCQVCGNTKKTLHVHHFKYNSNPWNTPELFLTTVCEDCHREVQEGQNAINRAIQSLMAEHTKYLTEIFEIIDFMSTLNQYNLQAFWEIVHKIDYIRDYIRD